ASRSRWNTRSPAAAPPRPPTSTRESHSSRKLPPRSPQMLHHPPRAPFAAIARVAFPMAQPPAPDTPAASPASAPPAAPRHIPRSQTSGAPPTRRARLDRANRGRTPRSTPEIGRVRSRCCLCSQSFLQAYQSIPNPALYRSQRLVQRLRYFAVAQPLEVRQLDRFFLRRAQ